MHSPSLFYIGNFVIYIYCSGVILPLHLIYICICIYMFVHNIMVSAWVYLRMLYNITICCAPYGVFFPISIQCVGYYYTVLLLQSQWYEFVCEFYVYVY